MKPPGGKFARKKEEAIAALLTQRNIEEAAKVAGIGANTLLRWLKVPEFQTAYREARREIARKSVESKRPSELIDYATATPFAIGFLETALAIEDSSTGI